ncbi:unnamed protein product [Brachionus calyciflorus]|uniref:Hemimethylated DNA-binding domain-containing protein n=1 Tax=Brachionus calyciflorus TaxID=104777 RepID=A0A814DD83_9BILA|nr:unnamed protein product [Brachionus calyciflorus]
MDGVNLFKFILIALALPAQYYITQHWSNNNTEQTIAFQNLMVSVRDFRKNYFTIESWKKWYISFVIENENNLVLRKPKPGDVNYNGDDLAIEVLKYRKQSINFAESSKIRSPRPSDEKVKFRVGHVVYNKRLDIYGVIIGWDEECHAPETWIDRNYEPQERERLMNQPHYLLLVDEKYQDKFSGKVYVYQDDLERVFDRKIKHRNLNNFFMNYLSGQYVKKTYLQTVYPYD